MDIKDIGDQLASLNLGKTFNDVKEIGESGLPEDVSEFIQKLPYWNKEAEALWIQNPKETDNARKLGYSFLVKVKTDYTGFYLNGKKAFSWAEEHVSKIKQIGYPGKGGAFLLSEDKIEITLDAKLETLQQIVFPDLEKLKTLIEPAQQAIILENFKTFSSWEREEKTYVCHMKEKELVADYLTVGMVNSKGLYLNGELKISWADYFPRLDGGHSGLVPKSALTNVAEDPVFATAERYMLGTDYIGKINGVDSSITYLFGTIGRRKFGRTIPLLHESKGILKDRYNTLERTSDATVKSKRLEYKDVGGLFAKEKYFAYISIWASKASWGMNVLLYLDCFSLVYNDQRASSGEILQMDKGTLKLDLDNGHESIVLNDTFEYDKDGGEEQLLYFLGKSSLRKIAKAKKIKIILSCRVEVTLEANQLAQIARDFDKEIFDAPQHEYDYYDAEEYWEKDDSFSAAKYIVKAIEGCPNEAYYLYRKKDFFSRVYFAIWNELTAIKELVSKRQFKDANDKIKLLETKLDEDLRSHLVNYEDVNISLKEKLAEYDKVKAEIKELESRDLYEKAQTAMESSNFETCERYINEALGLFQAPEYITFKEGLIRKWIPELTKQADSLCSSGNIAEALKCLEKALQIQPNDTAIKQQKDDLKAKIEAKNKKIGIRILIGILAIVALFAIVFIAEKLSSTDDTYYDETEEVVEEDVANSESETVREESAATEINSTSDLSLFELKGNPKKVVYQEISGRLMWPEQAISEDLRVVLFDENGVWTNMPEDVERGPNNSMRASWAISLNDDGTICAASGASSSGTAYYYENGNLKTIEENIYQEQASSGVRVTKRDHHGNWIERETNIGGIERRIITYYGEVDNTEKIVVINGVNLRLRLGPSTEADCLIDESTGQNAHPEKGESYPYLGEADGFYKINFKGHEVYVSKDYAYIEE